MLAMKRAKEVLALCCSTGDVMWCLGLAALTAEDSRSFRVNDSDHIIASLPP